MGKTIESVLADFNKQYEPWVAYDAQEKRFYDVNGKERTQVHFPDPEGKIYSGAPMNNSIECRLAPRELALRHMILAQINSEVMDEMILAGEVVLTSNGVIDYHKSGRGNLDKAWQRMQLLLKERYNIFWGTPREETPGTSMF